MSAFKRVLSSLFFVFVTASIAILSIGCESDSGGGGIEGTWRLQRSYNTYYGDPGIQTVEVEIKNLNGNNFDLVEAGGIIPGTIEGTSIRWRSGNVYTSGTIQGDKIVNGRIEYIIGGEVNPYWGGTFTGEKI